VTLANNHTLDFGPEALIDTLHALGRLRARRCLARNDCGLLFVVTFAGPTPVRLEAWPVELDHCFTRLAAGRTTDRIVRRFQEACRLLGTEATHVDGRLVVDWPP
jgi:hypothetical protein